MKKFIFLILFLTVLSNTQAGIKDWITTPFKYTGKAIWWTASNKYVQKYGSFALFIYGQGICDAKCDGYIWDNLYGDGQTFGVSEQNWHAYKNIGRICTLLSLGLKGLAVGQDNMTLKEASGRFLSEAFITWVVWNKVYYKTRYNDYWDTDHAQRIIYYPNPFNGWNDAYIGMRGNQVYVWDAVRMGLGIGGLILIEKKW